MLETESSSVSVNQHEGNTPQKTVSGETDLDQDSGTNAIYIKCTGVAGKVAVFKPKDIYIGDITEDIVEQFSKDLGLSSVEEYQKEIRGIFNKQSIIFLSDESEMTICKYGEDINFLRCPIKKLEIENKKNWLMFLIEYLRFVVREQADLQRRIDQSPSASEVSDLRTSLNESKNLEKEILEKIDSSVNHSNEKEVTEGSILLLESVESKVPRPTKGRNTRALLVFKENSDEALKGVVVQLRNIVGSTHCLFGPNGKIEREDWCNLAKNADDFVLSLYHV